MTKVADTRRALLVPPKDDPAALFFSVWSERHGWFGDPKGPDTVLELVFPHAFQVKEMILEGDLRSLMVYEILLDGTNVVSWRGNRDKLCENASVFESAQAFWHPDLHFPPAKQGSVLTMKLENMSLNNRYLQGRLR